MSIYIPLFYRDVIIYACPNVDVGLVFTPQIKEGSLPNISVFLIRLGFKTHRKFDGIIAPYVNKSRCSFLFKIETYI